MLLWSARHACYAVALEIMESLLRVECRLAVDNKLTHGTVEADPAFVDDTDKRRRKLILDEVARMPPDASADKVADDELIHEEKVALHLVVESARDLQ